MIGERAVRSTTTDISPTAEVSAPEMTASVIGSTAVARLCIWALGLQHVGLLAVVERGPPAWRDRDRRVGLLDDRRTGDRGAVGERFADVDGRLDRLRAPSE